MKNLYLLIILLFLQISLSDDCPRNIVEFDGEENLEKCTNLKLLEGFKKCCLLSYKYDNQPGKTCFALKEDEVKNRDLALEYLKEESEGKGTGTIICEGDDNHSSFLKISLFSSLLILL